MYYEQVTDQSRRTLWQIICSAITVKLLINAPGIYLNTDLKTPAFNRDPAFIGDPASIRTLASSPLRLLMSVVPIFPVYVNFTLHTLILSSYLLG